MTATATARQSEAVIVVRMTPPREVSPNARVHFRRRARAVAAFRAEAAKAAQFESEGTSAFCGRMLPVELSAEIAWCCGRKRLDQDNAIASLKPLVDGISDWLWHGRDEHVRMGQITQVRGDGRVTITLRALADSEPPDP